VALFRDEGRTGQRRIQGIIGLTRRFSPERIETACRNAIDRGVRRYGTIRLLLEQQEAAMPIELSNASLEQDHALIRPSSDYRAFWETYSQMTHGLMPMEAATSVSLPHCLHRGESTYAHDQS
jgi:hypothetical protein